MDSLSQIVLGAAVGEAVAGKQIGRKAPLIGAIFGTIPDLDVFLKYIISAPVDQDLAHRGFSHSILFALLLALLSIQILKKLFKLELSNSRAFLFAFLATVTHPMLDIFTTWGTQFLWPLKAKYALNSIFVIDPLYTLPFLILTVWAICLNKFSRKRRFLNYTGLALSTTYLLFSFSVKTILKANITFYPSDEKVLRIDVKPMPLTSFYWMEIIETENKFLIEYTHLFKKINRDKPIEQYPKNHTLLNKYLSVEEIEKLNFVSKGFYSVEKREDSLFVYDLRFGTLNKLTNGKLKSPIMGYVYLLQQDTVSSIFKLSEIQDFSDITFNEYLNEIF